MRLLRGACGLGGLLAALAWSANAAASTLGTIGDGPLEMLKVVAVLMLLLWPLTLALLAANIVLSLFVIRWANQSLARGERGPGNHLPPMVKAAFFLSSLSFTLGPLTALPGVVCAHLARTDRNTPGHGLNVAALVIGYFALFSLVAGLLFSWIVR